MSRFGSRRRVCRLTICREASTFLKLGDERLGSSFLLLSCLRDDCYAQKALAYVCGGALSFMASWFNHFLHPPPRSADFLVQTQPLSLCPTNEIFSPWKTYEFTQSACQGW